LPLSARLRGEREGPGAQRREGEVYYGRLWNPLPHPALSAPGGGEGKSKSKIEE